MSTQRSASDEIRLKTLVCISGYTAAGACGRQPITERLTAEVYISLSALQRLGTP